MDYDRKIKTSKGEIYLPTIPNHILQDTSDESEFQYKHISLERFSDDELKMIGTEWTKYLIEHANFIRENEK